MLLLLVVVGACSTPVDPEAMDTGSSSGTDAADSSAGETSTGASGDSSATADSSDSGDTRDTPPDGAALFAAKCATCHGADANGSKLGYELRHPAREYSRWVIRNGRSGTELAPSVMPAFVPELLDDEEIEAILDYLEAFEPSIGGEALYLDHCRNCHGPDALGGEAQKNIEDKGFVDSLEKIRQGQGGSDYGGRITYMPAFDAASLTDDEVQQIADYIATL